MIAGEKMDKDTVLVFTQNGLGQGPTELQLKLAVKFLTLVSAAGSRPAKILFYTDGVKLACEGSPALEALEKMEEAGVELILCQTCLEFFHLVDKVKVGIVGGMGDIIEALAKAPKVISL
jgi:sulfur relay (sulfurtransferase) complex TusBCD TusD component (DsrE family)